MRCQRCGAFVADLNTDSPLVKDLEAMWVGGQHSYRRKDNELVLCCDGKEHTRPTEMAWSRALTNAEIAMTATEDCGGLILPPKKNKGVNH